MAYHYAHQMEKEHSAQALGDGLPISFKQSILICNMIRKKPLVRAKAILNGAIEMKTPIKYTKYNNGVGHRKGHVGPGRFPQKAAGHFLALLKSAEANAQFKGLKTENLVIAHILAQDGGNMWRSGRMRRRSAKRTSVEVVLIEGKETPKEDKKKVKAVKP